MPYRYGEGADKAVKSGRTPEYSDIEPAHKQVEKENYLRKQIYKKYRKEKKRKKLPIWMDEQFDIFASTLRGATKARKKKA